MKISIAMATYNGEKYLQEQLDSFVSQTRQPDELVVTDDCSTDATPELLEAFAQTAPFDVIVQRNERNYGYCGNFNQALVRASGDLVFLSDQDDVWFPEKIERMARAAQDHPEDLVLMNDAALTHGDLSETGLTKLGQINSAGFSEDSFVMGCCAAVRRDLLEVCLPIPEEFPAHDGWVVGIADGMRRKRVIPEVLQHYRRHGQNESQWIVNRTTRVSRWNVKVLKWKGRLKRWFKPKPDDIQTRGGAPSSQALLQDWVESAVNGAPPPYEADLRHYLDRMEARARAIERRDKIRRAPFPKRLREVIKANGDDTYAAFSGWKSAMRDLVGR
ncbi:glycosyltransferase family 2 protein [Spiribacter sp. 1M153]|uniref:glycosyltransferase family 2 protein n=1 Tax=Spiribacter roseus TaxID=1855875 RepID=UPI00349F1DC8